MSNNQKRLEKWIRQRMLMVGVDISRLTLRHATAGNQRKGGGSEIGTFSPPESVEDIEIKGFVSNVVNAAELDAEGLGGVQSYVLTAYDNEGGARARFTMRVESQDILDDSDFSEPATKQGSLGQQMRHNEALVKALVATQTQSAYVMTRMITDLNEQNSALMKGHVDQVLAIEQLLTQKHERDEMSRMNEAKIEAVKSGIESVKMAVPIALRRFASKNEQKALPPAQEPVMAIIKQLGESLTPEQAEQIMGLLTGPQKMGFLDLISAANNTSDDSGEPKH